MTLIKPNKLKAARALLGWSQSDLAEAAGLSAQTIKFYEQEASVPSSETLNKITDAFLAQDVYFTEIGVEQRDNTIRIVEGESPTTEIFKSILASTQSGDSIKEILIANGDERLCPPDLIDIIRKIRNAGIKMRHLVGEKDTYFMAELNEYRQIPEKYFTHNVIFIYGDKVVLSVGAETERVIIIKNSDVSEMQKKLFDYMWDQGTVPKKSTAHEKF